MKKILFILAFSILMVPLTASEKIPTEEEVAKLYVATFNRAPDSAGLAYWVNGSGLTLSKIAQSFFDQLETQTLYPAATSNRDFIESVYSNLFNRKPDQSGWNYWENELNTGSFSKNRFIEAVINGAQGDDRTILVNKTTVGLAFSSAGLDDVVIAISIMVGVSSDTNSVAVALAEHGITIAGTWKGTYTCSQGLTGLTLNIVKDIGSDDVTAVFSFYADDSNPTVPSGSYSMIGVYQDDLVLNLESLSWINNVRGYNMVDLNGKFNASFSKFTGNIPYTGCTTFSLSKVTE